MYSLRALLDVKRAVSGSSSAPRGAFTQLQSIRRTSAAFLRWCWTYKILTRTHEQVVRLTQYSLVFGRILERRDVQLIAYLTLSIRRLVLAPSEIISQLLSQWCRYVSSSSLQQGSKMYNRKPINVHPFREMYTRLWIHIHPLFIRHC